MGYLHIDNLYKNDRILLFRECYALEKIHGTSANVTFSGDGKASFFSGGEKHANFVKLFDEAGLLAKHAAIGGAPMTIFGEAYGGKCQGMKDTYGPKLAFVAFDVQIGSSWLSVPDAHDIVTKLGLEFVYYQRLPTDKVALDAARDAPSQQAIRNGCGSDKIAEGVVLRPLIEFTMNNGGRVIVKHKRPEFSEPASKRDTQLDPVKSQLKTDAESTALEWVTPMRLAHVVDKFKAEQQCTLGMGHVRAIINRMVEDVYREGAGEVVESKDLTKAISSATARMYALHLSDGVWKND